MLALLAVLAAEIDPVELGPKLLETSAAHFRRGNDDDGQKALDELVRLRPDLAIPADYPPLFHTLHKRAVQKAKDKAKGSIGLPAGALLNGRQLPAGTTRVSEVPAGVHYVTMGKETKRIIVKNQQIDVAFGRPDPAMAVLGNSVSFFPEEARVEPPRPVATAPVVPRPPIIAAPATTEARPPPPPARPLHVATPLYKQWWLWTAVGVVVAGAATGIALAATAKVGNVSVVASW